MYKNIYPTAIRVNGTYHSLPMGIVINNPFNIRYNPRNKWSGQLGNYNGFCYFQNLFFGVRAGIRLLHNYVYYYGCNTLESIISRFAPDSENNTVEYIRYVVTHLNYKYAPFDIEFSHNTDIKEHIENYGDCLFLFRLAELIATYECGLTLVGEYDNVHEIAYLQVINELQNIYDEFIEHPMNGHFYNHQKDLSPFKNLTKLPDLNPSIVGQIPSEL